MIQNNPIQLSRLRAWTQGGLAKDALRTTFWYLLRMLAQMGYLALIGRLLGASGLGLFAGVMAIGGFVAPMASASLGVVMIRKTSQSDEDLWTFRARALAFTLPAGLVACALCFVAVQLWFPADLPSWFVLQLLVSEVLVAALFSLCTATDQALGVPQRAQAWTSLLWLLRLVLLAALALVYGRMPVEVAAAVHLLSGVIVLALALNSQGLRWPGAPLRSSLPDMRELREGVSYAASSIATVAFTDLNQTLLLAILSARDAGIFAATYKLIVASTLLTSVLSFVSVKRLFEASYRKTEQSLHQLRTFAAAGLALGAVSSAASWLLSALLPVVLGQDFTESVHLTRLLAPIPLLIAGRTVAVALMTSHGLQGRRVWIECVIIPVSLGTNYVLASNFGLGGIVYGILAVELATTAVMSASVWRLLWPLAPGAPKKSADVRS